MKRAQDRILGLSAYGDRQGRSQQAGQGGEAQEVGGKAGALEARSHEQVREAGRGVLWQQGEAWWEDGDDSSGFGSTRLKGELAG